MAISISQPRISAFAASNKPGDVAGAVEQTWTTAKEQIKRVVTSLRPEVKARLKTYTCSIRKFQQVANTTEPLPISKPVALCVTYLLTQVKQLSSEAGQRSEF